MTTAQHAFLHDVRILACASCGAPLDVPIGGGAVACRYCRATSHFSARNEQAHITQLQSRPQVDEYQRYLKLKADDGKPMLPPQGLEHLIVGGSLPPQLLHEGRAEWQRALAEVRQGAGYGVHDRLVFITEMLYGALAASRQELQARAVVETTLETLIAPGHRSIMAGMLARSAARLGDASSAGAWLASCDPVSQEIAVDSDFRMSAAYVATVRHDFATVLHYLGQRAGDVPLAGSVSHICALLRANALERSGRIADAQRELEGLVQRAGVDALVEMRAFNAGLALCPTVADVVMRNLQARKQAQVEAASSFSKGIWKLVSMPFPVIGVALIIGGFFVDPASTTDDGHPTNVFLWVMGGFFVLTPLLPLAVSRAFMGKKASLPDEQMARGLAQVVSASPTGWEINDQTQLAVRARVFFEQRPPYEVDLKICVPPQQVPDIKPFASFSVLINPSDLNDVRPA